MPEPGTLTIFVNGSAINVPRGAMAIAAMLKAGAPCRVSEQGEPRTALCGMGICFECRASIDGMLHQRTCQVECREGMRLETQR